MSGLSHEDIDLLRGNAPAHLPRYVDALSGAARRRLDRLHQGMVRHSGIGLVRETAGQGAYEQLRSRSAQWFKRAFDVAGTLVGLVLISPILLAIALAIKLTSEGPVFFAQERLGQHGRWFKALKFRTMHTDAERRLQELLAGDEALREEYATYHKLAEDPRVTPIGRFLRKHSLDELPQLFNVLKGEMSLVGPRAYLPLEVLEMKDNERMLMILQVRPGLTGFWQVGGRNAVSFDERVDMEVFYVHHWSLGMDAYLLVNTAWVLFFGRGVGAA